MLIGFVNLKGSMGRIVLVSVRSLVNAINSDNGDSYKKNYIDEIYIHNC